MIKNKVKYYHGSKKKMKTKNIIFISGMLLDSRMWQHQVLSLSEDYNLYFIDYKPARNLDECLKLVDDLIQSLSGEIILVGFSLGGVISYEYAIKYPENIYRLILMGISPNEYSEQDQNKFSLMKKSAMKGEFQALSNKQLPIYFSNKVVSDSRVVQELKSIVNDCSRELFLSQLELVQNKTDRTKEITNLELPTLWICSDKDQLVDFRHIQEMSNKMKNSKTSLIEGCGHMMTFEKPDEVSELLLDWLE